MRAMLGEEAQHGGHIEQAGEQRHGSSRRMAVCARIAARSKSRTVLPRSDRDKQSGVKVEMPVRKASKANCSGERPRFACQSLTTQQKIAQIRSLPCSIGR